MKICFLDKTKFKYNSKDLHSSRLRGAETVLINLSNALSNNGHKVTIINNCPKKESINNICWKNIDEYNEKESFDIVFSNNDTRLFNKVKSGKKFLISHSLQTLEKFIRKKQLFGYLKYRPKIILLSNYHSKNRNIFLKIFGSKRIEWAVDDIFLNTSINNDLVENRAIFTSRDDRNLNILIDIWKNKIFSQNKISKLYVTPSNLINNKYNIFCRNFSTRNFLINDLIKSKVYLVPGHKSELFCIAAEEARELCVPIVTLGIGCLTERVIHGQTGFIAKNNNEFAKYTLDILNDNSIWCELRNNLIKLRGSKKWKNVASKLIEN